jgi:hypothetical protein
MMISLSPNSSLSSQLSIDSAPNTVIIREQDFTTKNKTGALYEANLPEA